MSILSTHGDHHSLLSGLSQAETSFYHVKKRVFFDCGEMFTETAFISGAGYRKQDAKKWQLLNFVVGQARLSIYKSRKDKIGNVSGHECVRTQGESGFQVPLSDERHKRVFKPVVFHHGCVFSEGGRAHLSLCVYDLIYSVFLLFCYCVCFFSFHL